MEIKDMFKEKLDVNIENKKALNSEIFFDIKLDDYIMVINLSLN